MMKKHIFLFTSVLAAALLGGCIAPENAGTMKTKPDAKPAPAKQDAGKAVSVSAGNIFTKADQLRMNRQAEKLAAKKAAEQARQENLKKGIKPAPAPKPDPEKQKYQAELMKKYNQAASLTWQNRTEESDKILDALDADKMTSGELKHKIITLHAFNLFRQKKYKEVIVYADRMLAKKTLPAHIRPALLEQKANALKELKDFDAQTAVLLERLGEDIPENQVFNLKRQIVFSLENAGRISDALANLRALEREPGRTDREKLQLLDDEFGIAGRTGDFDRMKAVTARIREMTGDPAKEVQYLLRMANHYAQAKKNGEADKLRKSIINDTARPMSCRISAYFAVATPIRGSEWGSKRRIFYELGNTLLKDSRHNPWKGKPAFENAAAEVQMRKNEDLTWIVDAIRELELSGANKLTLCCYLSEPAKRYIGGGLPEKLALMILETPEANLNQTLTAIRTLYDSALDKKQFAEADKLADRAIGIKGLRPDQYAGACAMKARVLAVQGKCDEAAAYLRRQLADPERKSIQMYRELANIYAYFFRTEDTVKVYLEAGDIPAALRTLAARWPDRAAAMAEKYLNDPALPENVRVVCMGYFLNSSPKARELRGKYPDLLRKLGNSSFINCARMAATNGDYRLADEMLDLIIQSSVRDFNNREYMNISFSTYAALNDAKKIHAYAQACAAAKGVDEDIRRTVKFIDGAFALPQKDGAFKKYCESFAFDKNATAKKRSDLIIYAAQLMMNARRFGMADEAYKVYRSLYKAEPRKTYEIRFSDAPVNGMEGFLRLAEQPEKQLMDRKFGGNMDFLVTDVSTGERASGIGSDKKSQVKPTEMQIVCDEYGVHFLFTAYDDKAREVQAGLGSAGSYEMYLAPGINQPYFCFLPNLNTGINHIWNTTYDNAQWHRLDPGFKKKDIKTDHIFTKDGYRFYMFLNWEKFYDKLPETGDLWEYENVHWSRFGGYSWNGIKTIHGRSTWGLLRFNISKEQSVRIKRHIIYEACKAYRKEKQTTGSNHGVIDRWQNDTVLGDPEFFRQKVESVSRKLDDALKLVKIDMDDATVETLYREAVPGWFGIKHIVSGLRRRYLEEKLSE